MPDLVVGLDIGGTKTAAAAVDASGGIGPVVTLPTRPERGPAAVLDTAAEAVRRVAAAAGRPPAALGVGTAGVVDADSGVIVSATDTFPDWPGTAVGAELHHRLAGLTPDGVLPVRVQNDVDAYAAGETWCGAAAGARCALVVAVGTGVGAAVVLDGTVRRGAHHLAGEIGHLPVPGAELLRCGCGRFGHLEAVGAGPAIHRHYRALGGDAPDTREVVRRAGLGDAAARRAVEQGAAAVGRAIAAVVTVLDPDVVVVGGGLAGAGDLWWSALRDTLRAETVDALHDLPLRPASLGGAAPIIGAARAAWQNGEG
ncbi:ROK family protein [Cellulomonas denverensis]|uniref:ROK family protein n=1 Tax=Cellulomonas denverensis TaxID=264297 RepID=A0A7X6QZW7_9CELL|nr:ROK family protein [Cellulomonas denverensis]NKY23516.1 ROK family protein [Cellulomonas denverensis]GIG25000.1 transcriptional regulator [Cellulomonas denverensis]